MRTKTLLLSAAIMAAGLATSMAQVFSVNVVGYVQKTVPAGKFALIGNPLTAATNTINALFAGVPGGFQVFRFDSTKGAFASATADDLEPAAAMFGTAGAASILPGEGVFVKAPTAPAAGVTITFVGEVPQGQLKNPLPLGLSIRSSQVPVSGTVVTLGLKGEDGDQVFQWDVTKQSYDTITYDSLDSAWLPAPSVKTLQPGDAFFLSKKKAGSWDRTFTAN